MKHFKTFESFVNEASLPFEIEKELRLDGIQFEKDEEREFPDGYGDLYDAVAYIGDDRRKGIEWVIYVGIATSYYFIEIQRDETVVFTKEYPRTQKAYFDQDCMNSLGFLPDFD